MKNAIKLGLLGLVFTVVSCAGEKKEEPASNAPAQSTSPAPEKKPDAKTKVDIDLNTKDGSIGVGVETEK